MVSAKTRTSRDERIILRFGWGCLAMAILCFICPKATAQGKRTIEVFHLTQEHQAIGVSNCYYAGSNIKFVWSGGDLITIFKGSTEEVFIFNPEKHVVFETNLRKFNSTGFTFTSASLGASKHLRLRTHEKFSFQNFPAENCDVLTPKYDDRDMKPNAIQQYGKTGYLKCLDCPGIDAKTADFAATSYGCPPHGKPPLELVLHTMSFPTNLLFRDTKLNPTKPELTIRLKTVSVKREQMQSTFFDTPAFTGYKHVGSEREVVGSTGTADAIKDMFLPE